MILSQAKVTSKLQITIPIRIVKKLNLHPGDMLAFDEDAKGIKLMSSDKTFSASDLTEKYRHISSAKAATPEDLKKAVEKGLTEKFQHL